MGCNPGTARPWALHFECFFLIDLLDLLELRERLICVRFNFDRFALFEDGFLRCACVIKIFFVPPDRALFLVSGAVNGDSAAGQTGRPQDG